MTGKDVLEKMLKENHKFDNSPNLNMQKYEGQPKTLDKDEQALMNQLSRKNRSLKDIMIGRFKSVIKINNFNDGRVIISKAKLSSKPELHKGLIEQYRRTPHAFQLNDYPDCIELVFSE